MSAIINTIQQRAHRDTKFCAKVQSFLMPSSESPRQFWVQLATQLATPVLEAASTGQLKARMPIEVATEGKGIDATTLEARRADRATCSHLEAVGRLLVGLAPWLELIPESIEDVQERELQQKFVYQAQATLASICAPSSPDFLNFDRGGQPLVDAAFLAQAILRAPNALWHSLDEATRADILAALRRTRIILPGYSNWLLFAATIEAFFQFTGQEWDKMRIDYALRQHESWYKGDGTYGDGPHFVWDYYNSYVIQPMMVDIVRQVATDNLWLTWAALCAERLSRYAEVQENLISPEGTFPMLGRSSAYRCGALQALAQATLLHLLPEKVSPSQVRCALSAVLRRQMMAPGTFDDRGWLTIGFCGHQPEIAERYISTGSLYLCSTALLPLGLPASDSFWSAPDTPWTQQKVWSF